MKNFKAHSSKRPRNYSLGTAHVSKESINDVESTIREENPDCVCVELDDVRYKSLTSKDAWQQINISQVLREGKAFTSCKFSSCLFSKKLGSDLGVKPGDEMKAAIEVSQELNIKTEMVDRPIHITLKRAWAKNRGWEDQNFGNLVKRSIFQ